MDSAHFDPSATARRETAASGAGSSAARGTVVEYGNTTNRRGDHERAARAWIAARLAALKGYQHGGDYDPAVRYPGPLYFVPADTLVSSDTTSELKICTEDDLFGGVVPYPFVATKAITHPLVGTGAAAPHGWSLDFSLLVQDAVLFGYTAYSAADAKLAVERVLQRGPARMKALHGIGGRGQVVIERAADAEAALAEFDASGLSHHGVTIEHHLEQAATLSVGRVRVGDLVASYWGTQRVTNDARGEPCYGGSDLNVVRGDYDALLALDLPTNIRQAVTQACIYEAAARQAFPGLYASRCNYDIAQGAAGDTGWRSGVLEQSWRIGGASAAEIVALERLREDPALQLVKASTFEVYGECKPPAHASILFDGMDESAGRITKYCVVE